jgi:glutathione S-transferase
MGRKPRAEVVATCNQAIDALAEQLGDKAYFCGDRPTTFDSTVYAFALGALCPAFDNEVLKHAMTKANLVSYVDRIKSQYWKE